ncbi:hypothetical protein ABZZ47_40275, partial [Streptomyces sp. NPDC006465]|uniref:hypothetical protein n=1 Tax=Streptomyces sp. NPDC006465 TaxID=3157174 RepID=UPI0033A03854
MPPRCAHGGAARRDLASAGGHGPAAQFPAPLSALTGARQAVRTPLQQGSGGEVLLEGEEIGRACV